MSKSTTQRPPLLRQSNTSEQRELVQKHALSNSDAEYQSKEEQGTVGEISGKAGKESTHQGFIRPNAVLQAKKANGSTEDPKEKEADQVADKVVQSKANSSSAGASGNEDEKDTPAAGIKNDASFDSSSQIPNIQKQTGDTPLEQLDDMLGWFNVPETKVISTCGLLDAKEKEKVRTEAKYKRRMANALNVGEMRRAVAKLDFDLETQLEWVLASTYFGTTFLAYSEIKSLVKAATINEKKALKSSTTVGKNFFVGICTNATIIEALDDLQFDLVTKLEWLKSEVLITSWEIDYSTIKPWIIHANTSQTERDSLKTNISVGKDFFVAVCTNKTMVEALDDLKFDLVTKLSWLYAEMTLVRAELDYSTIKPWITNSKTKQKERDSLKTNTEVGKDFFMKVCTNETIKEAVKDLKFDLQTQIEWVREEAGLEEVKAIIEDAKQAERDVAWKDAKYLKKLRKAVGDNYYLWVISKLRMKFTGTVKHTSALDADAAIRTHLKKYVKKAVKAGRKIEGMVAVVDAVNWKIAGEHRYGASTWAKKRLAGFVDKEDRVWINQNAGNVATMVHEGVHKYALDAILGISQPLNEGVTEYFTRIAATGAGLNITARRNYQKNYTTTQKLVALVGEATVAKAYFDGEVSALEKAFIKKKSASDWSKFIKATKSKQWSKANGYL